MIVSHLQLRPGDFHHKPVAAGVFAPGFAEGSLDGAVLTRSASTESLLRADTLEFGGAPSSEALSDIHPRRLPLTPPPEAETKEHVAPAITPEIQPVAPAMDVTPTLVETLEETSTACPPVVRSSGSQPVPDAVIPKPVPIVRSPALGGDPPAPTPVPSVRSPALPNAPVPEVAVTSAGDGADGECDDDGPSMYEDGSYWKFLALSLIRSFCKLRIDRYIRRINKDPKVKATSEVIKLWGSTGGRH